MKFRGVYQWVGLLAAACITLLTMLLVVLFIIDWQRLQSFAPHAWVGFLPLHVALSPPTLLACASIVAVLWSSRPLLLPLVFAVCVPIHLMISYVLSVDPLQWAIFQIVETLVLMLVLRFSWRALTSHPSGPPPAAAEFKR